MTVAENGDEATAATSEAPTTDVAGATAAAVEAAASLQQPLRSPAQLQPGILFTSVAFSKNSTLQEVLEKNYLLLKT